MIEVPKGMIREKHLIAHHEHINKRIICENISQGLSDTFIR